MNRVGHAFFKQAMREHDAAFGGEVSGHYYFRDFWCADSGTLPALLVLELLGVEGTPMSELVGAFRERYFISGEINSEVADQRRQDEGDRRRGTRMPRSAGSMGSRSTTRIGTSTSARRTPSRCCASTSSRWSRARTWSAKRDAVLDADPFVSAPDEALAAASRGRDQAAADPDPVRGRAGQLLPDRGRAAHARRHGPNSGKSLDELQHQLDDAGYGDRADRARRDHPPAHRPPRPGRDRRRRTRAPRWPRSTPSSRSSRATAPTASATTSSPAGSCAATGSPTTWSPRCAASRPASAAGARRRG